MPLILSLFPGIGLFDYAFDAEGFCVVRGPDCIWGGDIRTFHPPAGRFDGVIGGPPCQSFSSLSHLVRHNGHEPKFGNLIPEFERCVAEAKPAWFLMEEVRQAPVPVVAGYGVHSFLLENSSLLGEEGFGQKQIRLRRFSFGMRGVKAPPDSPPDLRRWIDFAVFLLPDRETAVVGTYDEATAAFLGRRRHETVSGVHDKPPSARDKQRSRTVTALGPDHLTGLADSTTRQRRAAVAEDGRPTRQECRKPTVTALEGGQSSRTDSTRIGARRYRLEDALRLQGLPEDHLKDCPMTAAGKLKAVANGVPVMMGRALARAIKEATE